MVSWMQIVQALVAVSIVAVVVLWVHRAAVRSANANKGTRGRQSRS